MPGFVTLKGTTRSRPFFIAHYLTEEKAQPEFTLKPRITCDIKVSVYPDAITSDPAVDKHYAIDTQFKIFDSVRIYHGPRGNCYVKHLHGKRATT